MKNSVTDLNNHLFAQLEKLGDKDLTGEALSEEISRSKAMVSVSSTIVESHKNTLEAMQLFHKNGMDLSRLKDNGIIAIGERDT